MEKARTSIVWGLLAVAGLTVAIWSFRHAMPFYPRGWTLTRAEAVERALASFAELGEMPEDPYVVVQLASSVYSERLLQNVAAGDPDRFETLLRSPLADNVLEWRVTVYEPGARPQSWTYRTEFASSGELNALELRVPPDQAADAIDAARARREAEAFLARMGIDLARYGEPELRRTDLDARTDLVLRYRDREALLGDGRPYGVEVTFAGDRLAGFRQWLDDPDQEALQKRLQFFNLFVVGWILMPFLLFPFIAVYFLRRYHAGEIGVRRGVQVFLAVMIAGAVQMLMVARSASENVSLGVSRELTSWVWPIQIFVFWFSAIGLIAALSWLEGEARCRERWAGKLAAFDALLQRRWRNATVARSAQRGLGAGMALGALLILAIIVARQIGLHTGVSMVFGPWWEHASWPGLTLVLFVFAAGLYGELFTLLFLLPAAVRRFGRWAGGAAVVVLASLLFWPAIFVDPVWWSPLFSLLKVAIVVALFLRYDLLTALIASFSAQMLFWALPFLLADAPFLQLQGVLPLVAVAIPFLLSARYLGSDREFEYRYADIPAHVRRIAERERQRVELETARSIQTSILPELPSQLAGVELAHCYLPATEVGGDFYDVLDLEDGRLAVAVGDVAGHGVSSGLVMSIAKSTLALQVTVDPDVDTVLSTLNRMVYRSARLRLLTTLCYAVVDVRNRELTYSSAGHLAPYRVGSDGNVEALPSASYPLGVRDRIEPTVRTVPLAGGDYLFLYSDGVVEARRDGSDELFGFERLEASLARHAGRGPTGLRDGVLEDLRRFTGGGYREDDQTILILKLPD